MYFRGIRPGLIEACTICASTGTCRRCISGASAPASLKLRDLPDSDLSCAVFPGHPPRPH